MPEYSNVATPLPELRWNTHAACLQRLCDPAARALDLADVAGLTGIAFRTALCRQVSSAGLYHSWSHGAYFRRWLDALGLDGEVTEHQTSLPTYAAWAARQPAQTEQTLARGFPVLYFDNIAFGLILGSHADGYVVSGVPEFCVNPLWLDHPDVADWPARLMRAGDEKSLEPKPAPCDCFTPLLDAQATLVYVHGVGRFDPERAAAASVIQASAELAGRLEYPRIMDTTQLAFEPQYGTQAIDRWREELKARAVNLYGHIAAVNSLAEARRLGWLYLRRLPERLPEQYRGRIEQVAEFFERIVAHFKPAQQAFSLPLDPDNQLTRQRLEACREALYQVQQTEQTVARLLAGVAADLAE